MKAQGMEEYVQSQRWGRPVGEALQREGYDKTSTGRIVYGRELFYT